MVDQTEDQKNIDQDISDSSQLLQERLFRTKLCDIFEDKNPQFIAILDKIKKNIAIFLEQVRKSINAKKSGITVTIHSDGGVKFQYVMSLEIRPSGATYDLLTFTFYPFLDDEDFPMRISSPKRTDSEGEEEVNCESVEDFENFLIERAKDICRNIKMLSTLANQ